MVIEARAEANDEIDPPALSIDPFSDEVLRNPYAFFEKLREAPVSYLTAYGCYAVGRHDDVTLVATDYKRFTSEGGIGLSDIRKPGALRPRSPISEVDPPDHTAVRAALMRIISPAVVRSWREAFEKQAEIVVAEILERREFCGVKDFAEAFVLKVFPAVLGSDAPPDRLIAVGELNFNQMGPDNDRLKRSLERTAPIMDWYARALERKNLALGGVGARIFEAEDSGAFAEGTAPAHVRTFFRAGTDTTVASIGFALQHLAGNPEQFSILRNERQLARQAFEETIRIECPAYVVFRTTTDEVDLNGYRLKADHKVGYFPGCASRDPRRWDDADRFDIRRQSAGLHLSFGVGAHNCVGQMIARLEAECILKALATRVRSLEMIGPPVVRPINTLRTLDSLPLRIQAA